MLAILTISLLIIIDKKALIIFIVSTISIN